MKNGHPWKSKAGNRPIPPEKSRGFILPLVAAFAVILMILGWMFLSSTMHTKTMFRFLFQDDLIRNIAESVSAEARLVFSDKLKTDSELRKTILHLGSSGKTVAKIGLWTFSPKDLPLTREFVSRLPGKSDEITFSGDVSISDVDSQLKTPWGRSKFGSECQATIQLLVRISSPLHKRLRRSVFRYEYDLKVAALRTSPSSRNGEEYVPDLESDYVLFVRNAYHDFSQSRGRAFQFPRKNLVIHPEKSISTEPPAGKIFLGSFAGTPREPVRLNVHEPEKWLLPSPPAPVPISPQVIKNRLPATWKAMVSKGVEEAKKTEEYKLSGLSEDSLIPLVEKELLKTVSGELSFSYHPLPPVDYATSRSGDPLVGTLFYEYSQEFSEGGFERNLFPTLQVWGPNASQKNRIFEGAVRSRFWQNVHFSLKGKDKTLTTPVVYYPPHKIGGLDPARRELYELLYEMQEESPSEAPRAFFSQPNDFHWLKPSPAGGCSLLGYPNPLPQPEVRGLGENGVPRDDLRHYRPFGGYLVRSYQFPRMEDLMSTPLWDESRKIIHLRGIMCVKDRLFLPKGWKYRGQGVLYSYGTVFLEGDFGPVSPAEDGPCVVLSDGEGIEMLGPASVSASLVAMRFGFAKGENDRTGRLKTNGLLTVSGNLAVDSLWADTNGGLESDCLPEEIHLTYDSSSLSGRESGDAYSFYLGGQIRRETVAYEE